MLAVTTALDGVDAVRLLDIPDAVAAPGEVLVRVHAASVSPADVSVAAGRVPAERTADAPRPIVPGWDLVGEVVAEDAGRSELRGRRVVGFIPWFAALRGGQSELVALPATQVAPIADSVSTEVAAGLGLDGMTAVQLLGMSGVDRGDSLLVTGAAGAVGALVVQLAAARGVRVLAQGSPSDEQVLRDFGAEGFVPRDADLAIAARDFSADGVDAVANTVPKLGIGLGAVRDGGRYRSITAVPEPERGVDVRRVGVRPDAEQLSELVDAVSSGGLRVRVAASLPAERAVEAYAVVERPGRRGAVVLTFGA